MPRHPRPSKAKKGLTLVEQGRAIAGVAKLSFQTAPGAIIFKVIGAILNAVLPLVTTYFAALTTTQLVEAYSGAPGARQKVIVYVLITAALGLLMTVWRSIDQYIQAKMRYSVEARVSDRMYEHFLQLDYWRYDDKDTADLYDKAKKFSQFFAYIFDRLAEIFSQFIVMVVGIIALALVNYMLGLFVLVALIPGVYLQFRLSREQMAHWNSNVDARRSKWQIEEMLLQPNKIAELRLYGMVRHLLDLRMNFRDTDERARIEFERKYIPKRLAADALEALAEVISLIWVALQIASRAQPIGQFIYVQQIVSRAMNGASSFVSQLSTIDEDVANLFDYQQFMQLEEYISGTRQLAAVPNEITFRDVSFHYPGDEKPQVLSHINMTIKHGQHIAIVGENGAGKSTLIKLLTGIYRPTSGAVLLDNAPLDEFDVSSWHRNLGVLQQDFTQYMFANARDNLRFGDVGKSATPERVKDALKKAEAETFIGKLPQGLDSFINPWMEDDEGHKGTALSGGQWQRLALARNFFRDAPIVVLDEPTSAIDALAEARIFDRLFKEKDRTIVTISHRVTTIEQADVIYMLENGEVVEQGTHDELVAKHGRYYRMFKAQLKD